MSRRGREYDTRLNVLGKCAAAAILLLLGWNLSMLTVIVQHRDEGLLSLLKSGDGHATASNPAFIQPQESPKLRKKPEKVMKKTSELPWFLKPETYKKQKGCDFANVVSMFKPEELDINCDNIDELALGEYLGEGFWREVYHSKWQGREIAIKKVKDHLLNRTDILPRHVQEAAATFSIRDAPNIVSLVGWCNTTVVVDYVPTNLDDLLFESQVEISPRRSLELALDAAKGVAQLHAAKGGPFTHTDLQPRQFLVDANGRLLLNDFNRLKYAGPRRSPDGLYTGPKCHPITPVAKGKWRSPEEFAFQPLDEKLDVYSVAVVIWSIGSRNKPFEDMARTDVYEAVQKGMRPPVDEMESFPKEMQDVVRDAWQHNPAQRPSAVELADKIEVILKNHKDETN